jgi:hypothetical protein
MSFGRAFSALQNWFHFYAFAPMHVMWRQKNKTLSLSLYNMCARVCECIPFIRLPFPAHYSEATDFVENWHTSGSIVGENSILKSTPVYTPSRSYILFRSSTRNTSNTTRQSKHRSGCLLKAIGYLSWDVLTLLFRFLLIIFY